MPTRRERRAARHDLAIAARPAYYLAPYSRPSDALDPLGALAWDQTEHWMTPREWLDRLRRGGRPYKVYGRLTGCKWVPQSRPCVRAHSHPSSTLMRGYLPDGKYATFLKRLSSPVANP